MEALVELFDTLERADEEGADRTADRDRLLLALRLGAALHQQGAGHRRAPDERCHSGIRGDGARIKTALSALRRWPRALRSARPASYGGYRQEVVG